jgi:hypothetical protein
VSAQERLNKYEDEWKVVKVEKYREPTLRWRLQLYQAGTLRAQS